MKKINRIFCIVLAIVCCFISFQIGKQRIDENNKSIARRSFTLGYLTSASDHREFIKSFSANGEQMPVFFVSQAARDFDSIMNDVPFEERFKKYNSEFTLKDIGVNIH